MFASRNAIRFFGSLLVLAFPGVSFAQTSWTLMDGTGGSVYDFSGAGLRSSVEWDPDGPGPARSLLVVGGGIEFAGASRCTGVAAWDGHSWRSMGSGLAPSGSVSKLIVYRGDLYAIGSFTQDSLVTPTQPVVQFAKWDGANWRTVAPAKPVGNPINAVVWQDRLVLIADANGFNDGQGLTGAVTFDGTSFARLGGQPAPLSITCATVFNGTLVVGGKSLVGPNAASLGGIACWNASSWQPLNAPGISECLALHVHEGTLIAAGVGTSSAGPSSILGFDGASWTQAAPALTGRITVLGSHAGKLVAGPLVSGSTLRLLLRDGSNWTIASPMNGDSSFQLTGNGFSSLSTFRGDLYVAGSFVYYKSSSELKAASNIVKVHDSQVRPIQSLPGAWVSQVASHEGCIYAIGSFSLTGSADPAGSPTLYRRTGAEWHADGALLTGENGLVRSRVLLSTPDGLYLGGLFRSIDGVPADCLARRSGGTWVPAVPTGTMAPFSSSANGILAIVPFEGDIVVGGLFTVPFSVDGPLTNILRIHAGEVRAMGTLPRTVRALKVYDGTLYALTDDSIRQWDGSAWATRASVSGVLYDFAFYDGVVYVARDSASVAFRLSDWVQFAPSPIPNALAGFTFEVLDGTLVMSAPSFLKSRPVTPLIRRTPTSWASLDPSADVSTYTNSVTSIAATQSEIFAGGLAGMPLNHWFVFGNPSAPYVARYSKDGLPRFEGQPISCVRPSGSNVRLAATCVPGVERRRTLTFQWYRNGVVIDDTVGPPSVQGSKTAFLSIRGVTPELAGEYQAIATNEFGSIESQPAILSVSCVGDLTGDSLVEDADFSAFVVGYNQLVCTETQSAFGCPGDLNADGFVNDDDFQVFVAAYDELLCP